MKLFLWTLAIMAVVGGLLFALKTENAPKEATLPGYDTFAQCISDSGAKFYGAYWCPHCQDQKREFGASAKLLPYVECAKTDGSGQTAICVEKKITGYPTWIFKDGTIAEGKQEMKTLAEKTGCALPPEVASSTPSTK